FRISFQEIKVNNQIKKELYERNSKMNIFSSFIYMNYMFLIMYFIVYIALLYLVVVGIFLNPLAFIPLVTTTIFLCIATLIHAKVYPKTRKDYLKSINFYKEV